MSHDLYDQEADMEFVRCLLCGLTVERHEWDIHWADCDVLPFEVI